jgi:competence protein ComEC
VLWPAGFIAGVAAGLSAGYFPYATAALVLSVFVLVFLVNYRVRLRCGRTLIVSFLFLISLAFGVAAVKINYAPAPDPSELAGSEILIKAKVLSSPQKSLIVFPDKTYDSAGREIKGPRQIKISGPQEFQLCGVYNMRLKIANDIFLNPGGTAQQLKARLLSAYQLSNDASFIANAECLFSRMKYALNSMMQESFSADSAAFLMSVTTGYRGGFSPELRDAFSSTGLAHLISISGTHFGLLFFVVFFFFKRLLALAPYRILAFVTIYATPSQIAAILSMPVMIFYLGLSDMNFPAVRSFIMISFLLAGLLFQRKGLWLNTVLLAAVIILVFRPDSLLDLSFQLSFTAVICIGLAADAIKKVREAQNPESKNETHMTGRITEKIKKFLFSSGIISIAASAGTAPLVAYYFHYFSIISPVANLIVTPIAGFVMLPLALIASFIFLFTGIFPFVPVIEAVTSLCIWLIRMMAGFSLAEVKTAAYPLAMLLVFYASLAVLISMYAFGLKLNRCFRLKTYAAVFTVGLLLFSAWPVKSFFSDKITKITFLDTGQADSAVAELSDGRVLVIDTGRNGFPAASYLGYRGINRINALVITHAEDDHAGGAGYLASRFRIGEVWDNGMNRYSGNLAAIPKRKMLRGDYAESGRHRMTSLHPRDSFYTIFTDDSGENNDSLVLMLDTGKNRFLFCGDIAQEAVDDMTDLEDALKADVIKVPHHGSRTSADELFYFYVSPRIAVVSSGRNNQYGHPHPETVSLLEAAAVFRTDTHGAVQIREQSNGALEVRTWKDALFVPAEDFSTELANFKRLFIVW